MCESGKTQIIWFCGACKKGMCEERCLCTLKACDFSHTSGTVHSHVRNISPLKDISIFILPRFHLGVPTSEGTSADITIHNKLLLCGTSVDLVSRSAYYLIVQFD